MERFIKAIVIAIVVSIGLWLLAQVLVLIEADITRAIATFLDRTNVIIGLMAGIWYYFFGDGRPL